MKGSENSLTDSSEKNHLKCRYYPVCNGCQTLEIPVETQKINKTNHLKHLLQKINVEFADIGFYSVGLSADRVRFDFTIEHKLSKTIFGLYSKNHELIDLEQCPQLNQKLNLIFVEFKTLFIDSFNTYKALPFKGSVRVRVGPNGEKGVWLDWPNLKIKEFLDQGTFLKSLLNKNFQVEIGQKGKRLAYSQNTTDLLKLVDPSEIDPTLFLDFFSVLNDQKSELLKCSVSDFTQPSVQGGSKLIQFVSSTLNDFAFSKTDQILEFGSGIGPFTKALALQGYRMTCVENDLKSLLSFKMNLADFLKTDQVRLFSGDFQNEKNQKLIMEKIDGPVKAILVNPPRSGLKSFLSSVLQLKAPYCYYISCFPESLARDLEILCHDVYKIKKIEIVDQFPHTEHFETCVLLQRVDL